VLGYVIRGHSYVTQDISKRWFVSEKIVSDKQTIIVQPSYEIRKRWTPKGMMEASIIPFGGIDGGITAPALSLAGS